MRVATTLSFGVGRPGWDNEDDDGEEVVVVVVVVLLAERDNKGKPKSSGDVEDETLSLPQSATPLSGRKE